MKERAPYRCSFSTKTSAMNFLCSPGGIGFPGIIGLVYKVLRRAEWSAALETGIHRLARR
jgi:hypothetical protein